MDQVVGATGIAAQGELRRVGLAEQNAASRADPSDDRRILARHEILAAQRAASRHDTGGIEGILDRERHAMQRAQRLAAGQQGVGRCRFRQCAFAAGGDHGVELGVHRIDAREAGLDHVHRGDLLAGDHRGDFGDRFRGQRISSSSRLHAAHRREGQCGSGRCRAGEETPATQARVFKLIVIGSGRRLRQSHGQARSVAYRAARRAESVHGTDRSGLTLPLALLAAANEKARCRSGVGNGLRQRNDLRSAAASNPRSAPRRTKRRPGRCPHARARRRSARRSAACRPPSCRPAPRPPASRCN